MSYSTTVLWAVPTATRRGWSSTFRMQTSQIQSTKWSFA